MALSVDSLQANPKSFYRRRSLILKSASLLDEHFAARYYHPSPLTPQSNFAHGSSARMDFAGYCENYEDIKPLSWFIDLSDPARLIFIKGIEGRTTPLPTFHKLTVSTNWRDVRNDATKASPATELYGQDELLLRVSGQKIMDARYQMVSGADMTRNQAKTKALKEDGFAWYKFTDLRVKKVWMCFMPFIQDYESGYYGVWMPCEKGDDGAIDYWQVTVNKSVR